MAGTYGTCLGCGCGYKAIFTRLKEPILMWTLEIQRPAALSEFGSKEKVGCSPYFFKHKDIGRGATNTGNGEFVASAVACSIIHKACF